MKRRLAALAASAFLLNLNVLGVERACGPRHAPAYQPGQAHSGHGTEPVPVPEPDPAHDAPAKCCDAISSCGMTLSLGHEITSSPQMVDARMDQRVAFRSPGSMPRAPEPPPPRA